MQNIDKLDAVLTELSNYITKGWVKPADFKEGLLSVGIDAGRFIQTLTHATSPKMGLEVGTSSGFSALCAIRGALLAGADFHLVTIEYDAKKAEWAQSNFERAGVADRVTIIVEDGLQAVKKMNNKWDYVLLDAAKLLNLPIMKELIRNLNLGAVVLTDNISTHPNEMLDFQNYVRNHPELSSAPFYIGNGLEMTIKTAKDLFSIVSKEA